MAGKIEWIAVRKFKPYPIGAVGFIGNDAVAVVSFFADADANQDGTVSKGEWLGSKIMFKLDGKAVAEVAMQGRVDPDIIMRDPTFPQMAAKMFVNFATGLVAQGVYQAYFARGVALVGNGVASRITSSMVKQLAIRKGFETAVKSAFVAATKK
jgi:hypothetical protein